MPKRPAVKPLDTTEQLAELCSRQRTELTRAGRSLHDNAGPLLSAAGIHLQLLRLDVPAAEARIQEVVGILEQALENVRMISQDLAASPVYRGGLERALKRLAEEIAESVPVEVHVDFTSGAIPREVAVSLYEAAVASLRAAVREGGATEVEIQVRDKPSLTLKVTDNGRTRGRINALTVPRLLAHHSGLRFEISTGKGTIVSVRAYALRRPVGR